MYASILEVLVFYLVNTVMFVIFVTVRIRHLDVGMQELLGQIFSFRHHSPHSTIPRRGVIFVPKGYQILDIGPVSQNKHSGDSQETISHQTDLEIRGNNEGYLFIYKNGSPVSRSHFSDALNGALSFTGLSAQRYKGHSFRIGAATWAMQIGKTDSQIRVMGRWHSNAFLKYIRPYS